MKHLSVVIITYNEARHLEACIQSVEDIAHEIIVVDSGSTDGTIEIAERLDCDIAYRPFDNFANQKNFALSLASCPWILSIDADERLSEELASSIAEVLNSDYDNARSTWNMERLNHYCGKPIKHSGWYPDKQTRLLKNGAATWNGLVHESLQIKDGSQPQLLSGELLHYTSQTIEQHVSQINRYSTLRAQRKKSQSSFVLYFKLFFASSWKFFHIYLFKGGFLDGFAGLCIAILSAYGIGIANLKALQMKREGVDGHG